MKNILNELKTFDYWRCVIISGTAYASFLILKQIAQGLPFFPDGPTELFFRCVFWGMIMSFFMSRFKKSIKAKKQATEPSHPATRETRAADARR